VGGDQRNDGATDSGAAYVFQRAGDSWYQSAYVKADRPGVDAQVAAIEGMLALAPPGEWKPPVVCTTATTGDGVDGLLSAVLEHQHFLDQGQRRHEARRRRACRRVERLLAALIQERMRTSHHEALAAALAEVGRGDVDPYSAARRLLDGFCKERP
jgi:LAO/AO transport system kinase